LPAAAGRERAADVGHVRDRLQAAHGVGHRGGEGGARDLLAAPGLHEYLLARFLPETRVVDGLVGHA